MDDKHNPLKPWGSESGYSQERNPADKAADSAVTKEAIRMGTARTITRWICITALLISTLKAATTVFDNWNDNRTVSFVTLMVGPGAVPPHDPSNGNHSF